MAGTTVAARQTGQQDSDVLKLRLEFNKVITDLEALRAFCFSHGTKFNAVLTKLDADAGVTDVNYNSTQAVVLTTVDAASDMTAAKVANQDGSTTT